MVSSRRTIPTHPLRAIAELANVPGDAARDVFILDYRVESPGSSFGAPYRSDYYGVGICLGGHARFSTDLQAVTLRPQTVLATPPETIKQWNRVSPDFRHIAVFFTRDFLADTPGPDLDRCPCFDPDQPVARLAPGAARSIGATLVLISRKFRSSHPQRAEILRSLIAALLIELAGYWPTESRWGTRGSGRGARLTSDFKKLVKKHIGSQRSMAFYAGQLAVTPRHLSATVREHTGMTAGRWIQQSIVLEARVLLLEPKTSIGSVAETLGFPNQSSFGKFFKARTGRSPQAYRQDHPTS